MKPRILVTPCQRIEPYLDAINRSGGEAILYDGGEIDLSLDGLLLTGGPDIHPSYFGEEINGAVNIDEARDKSEFAITKAYTELKKPILAICRGCQLINAFFGGTLHQHLPNADEHRSEPGTENTNNAYTTEGTLARRIFGERPVINSYHHQAIKDVADGFKVSIISVDDNVIEGIEHKTLPIWAFQCHPERMCYDAKGEGTQDAAGLFKFFVEECGKKS